MQLNEKARIFLYFVAFFDFSDYDVSTSTWKAEPGDFAVLVGSSSAQIELQGEFSLK